ncbi:putative fructokinase-5 [Bienertia sinuspersici]
MTKSSIVSFGEMLIDFVPDEAGVSLAESCGFIKAPGGAPANVGDDEFGKMLVEILARTE